MVIVLGVFLLIVAWAMVVGLVAIIVDAETFREVMFTAAVMTGMLVGAAILVTLVVLGLDLIGVTP